MFTCKLQVEAIKALAHPSRLRILELLRDGELCVCEMEPRLGLRQANLSQHLAVLRANGLVEARKEGLRVIYRVADPRIFQVLDGLSAILAERHNSVQHAISSW
ncbi:MAG: metalloregulator ArsR/SmtB family transcription factor [Chloroflexota bacterium]